jgi:hypothetical protein
MNPRDRLELTLAVLVAFSPLAVNLILLMQRVRYSRLPLWRERTAKLGLVFALVASFPTPLFYFALELPKMNGPRTLKVMNWSLPAGLAAGVFAIVLLAFGKGRARWMGIATSLLSVAMLYLTLLGLSD